MVEETKKCPYCAESVKAEAIICRFCNRDISGNVPVAQKKVVHKTDKKPLAKNIIIAVIASVILVCCGLFALGGMLSDTNSKTRESISSDAETDPDTSQPNIPQPTSRPPTPTLLPVAPSIEEILATVENMTDAQRNQYIASLEGNRVEKWRGIVDDVDEGEIFGGFSVYVDMVESNFGSEVHIEVSQDVALSLNKGQEIEFSGDIKSVSDIFGTTVFIENAVIEPAK